MRSLILFVCFSANLLFAQSPIAQQLPVDFSTNLLSVDLADNGQGFAAGTCGSLLKTTNGGEDWAVINSPTDNEDIGTIRCRPGTDCQQVFAATTQTLYRSLNGGDTWTETPIPGNGSILDIVFTGDTETVIISRNVTTLTFSSDNGATLEQRGIGHAPATPIQFVDPQRGFFFSNMRRLIATEDGGVTWTDRYEHTEGIRGVNFVDENNGFFYSGSGIVFVTSDGGTTWSEAGSYPDIRFLFTGMTASTTDELELFTTRGVHRSTDGGATFTQLVNINSLNSVFGDVRIGEIRRVGAAYWMACTNSAMLYSADDFATIDHQIGGERPAFRDIAIAGDNVYAITFQDGLYRSDDRGDSYALVPDDDFISGYDLNVTPNGSVIVSGNGSPRISTDEGMNFTTLLPGSVPNELYRAVEVLSTGRIVAGGEGGTTAFSDDNGATWTIGGSHGLMGTLLNISSAGEVVSLNTRDNYSVSTDGGMTWSGPTANPENVGVQPSMFVVDADNWLISTFPSGRLQHTADGGLTWTDTGASAFAMTIDDNGRLYGLDDDQIIFSESQGARWETATDVFCSSIGLEQGGLAYDADNEVLYVGSFGHRIFSVDVSGLVSSTRTAIRPQPLKTYPNPTSGWLMLELPTGAAGPVDVQVISAAGQVVSQQRHAAAPRLQLELAGQPAGLYTVRVAGEGWLKVGRVVLSK